MLARLIPFCACGCGGKVSKRTVHPRKLWNKFIKGHNSRIDEFQQALIKRSKEACGEKGSRWNGGEYYEDGYVYITFLRYGPILRSISTMEKKLDRKLTAEEVVHHRNRIRDDDRIENLELFKNHSEHMKYHAWLRKEGL